MAPKQSKHAYGVSDAPAASSGEPQPSAEDSVDVVEQTVENLTLEDENSSDGTDQEEAEEEEEDDEDQRSVDEHRHITGKDDDHDSGDGENAVLYNPTIDTAFMTSIQDLSPEDLEAWIEETQKELRKKFKQLKYGKKLLKEKMKPIKKELQKLRQKEKLEKLKKESQERREAVITVNVAVPDGSTKAITTTLAETVAGLRLLACQSITVPKGKTNKWNIYFNDTNISERPRATLGGCKLFDGCTVRLTHGLRGGGKPSGVKKMMLLKKKCITPTADQDAAMFEEAYKCAKEACTFTGIDIPNMVKALPVKTITDFKDYLLHNKSNTEIKLMNAGDFTIENVKMIAAIDKLEYACTHMRQVMFQALLAHYGNKEGNIKIADVIKDLDIQLAIRENAMED